ncbi:hypothetical protein EC991_000199, partial [Linnemannia zychae]
SSDLHDDSRHVIYYTGGARLFGNALYLRIGDIALPFLKGPDFKNLDPLRIAAVPGVTLNVVVAEPALVASPSPSIPQVSTSGDLTRKNIEEWAKTAVENLTSFDINYAPTICSEITSAADVAFTPLKVPTESEAGSPELAIMMATGDSEDFVAQKTPGDFCIDGRNIPEYPRPSSSSLKNIKSILKAHYSSELKIRRISGKPLDIDTGFVNLAIVTASTQREKEKQKLKEQAAVFHRIPSSEVVRGSDVESSIGLKQLFDRRKLHDGNERIPQRILVQGRAGIGKTTLCKKLVHAHQNGLWEDRFDAVLWLPLRQLRRSTSSSLQGLLREMFFNTQQFDREQDELANALIVRANEGKVLFILDGLDEIATVAQETDNPLIDSSLKILFRQQHVVVTSRPSGLNRNLLEHIDLELETIGFSQQDVREYVFNVLDLESAETVHSFIQRTPLIQGLVNIPVQLDVICFCWKEIIEDDSPKTMTRIYQLMVRKLWGKDAILLKKSVEGEILTEEEVKYMSCEEINEMMTVEIHHLGFLAFRGLANGHQIEFDHETLLKTFDDLKDYRKRLSKKYPSSKILNILKKTSFLHSVDADLDPNKENSQQTWSFLHLTFQEYFAAIWITSKMMTAGNDAALIFCLCKYKAAHFAATRSKAQNSQHILNLISWIA